VVAELKAKTQALPTLKGCRITHVVVSRAGFTQTDAASDCLLISLENEKCE